MADSRYLPSWLFLATTGCRRGERLGLRWADLDLERSTAILGHQVVLLNGKIQVKERSKTKRNHLIRLDTGTVAMLRNWRIRQNEMRLLAGAGFKDQGFVFAQPDGGPFHPERFTREFIRKQDQYNRANPDGPLPYPRLHGLRHTWATLALQEGIDIKIVSERLDHSSTHITRLLPPVSGWFRCLPLANR